MTDETKIRSGLAAALLIFLVAGAGCSRDAWRGTIAKEGDVTVVRNPKEPLYKTPILELKEELSLGGPEAESDFALDQVLDVAIDDAGSLYVLDGRSGQVKVFGASGTYLRTIGRLGQGPGEFERPMNLSLNRTTGELAVHEPGRMSFFGPDGVFARSVAYQGMGAVLGRVDSRGRIYRTEVVADENGARYVAVKSGPDGTVLAELAGSPAPLVPKSQSRKIKVTALWPISYFQLDRADNVVYGFPQTYDLTLFRGSDSRPFKRITRIYDPVGISAEEKEEFEKEVPPGSGFELEFPEYHSAYDRFFLSDLGRIFVRTWERTADGRKIHDVFDAEGRFIGRIPLKGIGFEILNGKYYALEEDEEGYQYVKRYAVTWTVK
jgi:hypothetical protein